MFSLIGEGATYSITRAGAAKTSTVAGVTYPIEGTAVVLVTVGAGAAYSITLSLVLQS